MYLNISIVQNGGEQCSSCPMFFQLAKHWVQDIRRAGNNNPADNCVKPAPKSRAFSYMLTDFFWL